MPVQGSRIPLASATASPEGARKNMKFVWEGRGAKPRASSSASARTRFSLHSATVRSTHPSSSRRAAAAAAAEIRLTL